MKKNKKRNVTEEVKNGIKDLEEKLTEIEKTMQISTKELKEEAAKAKEEEKVEEKVESKEEVKNEEQKEETESKEEVKTEEEITEIDEDLLEEPIEEKNVLTDPIKEETIEVTIKEEPTIPPYEEKKEELDAPKVEEVIVPEIKEEPVDYIKEVAVPFKEEKKLESKIEDTQKEVIEKPRVKKKEKTQNNAGLIIITCLVISLALYIFPLVFISLFAHQLDNLKSSYKELDNTIIVEDSLKISEINGYYDDSTKSYVVYGYVDNTDKKYLEISFELYDIKDYVIGSAETQISMTKGNKYKFKAIYSGVDANETIKYKLANVYCH